MKIDALSLSLKASLTVIANHLPETGCPECEWPIPLVLTGLYCSSPHPSQEPSISQIYPSHGGMRNRTGE